MLPAQVSYWDLQEKSRHNKAMEALTEKEIAEKVRHNQVDEGVRIGTLEEQKRNNLYGNRQGDMSLGLTAEDTKTRRFQAVSQASIGQQQARAALTSASAAVMQGQAALRNAATNEAVGLANVAINKYNARTNRLVGESTIKLNEERASYEPMNAQSQRTVNATVAAKNRKDVEYADFYANDRATQTDIQRQRAYNEQFGKILDNMTPWQ